MTEPLPSRVFSSETLLEGLGVVEMAEGPALLDVSDAAVLEELQKLEEG